MKKFKELKIGDTICYFSPEMVLYSMKIINIENNDTFTFESSSKVFHHKIKLISGALEKSFIVVKHFNKNTYILGTDIRIKPFIKFLMNDPNNLKQEIIEKYVEKALQNVV